jgi:cholesterol transport system auxiliary component
VIFSLFRDTGRRRARCVKILVSVLLPTALAACTGLFHSDARPEQVYYLRAKAAPVSEAGRTVVDASVRVGRPVAAPGLDSSQIVLLQADHRMSFFSASRWPASVPDVVEMLAIETLRASGSWTSVENSASPFPSDYLLQISVRRFEAEYGEGGGPPDVHVVLDCLIGRREGRDVVASFVAEGSSVATTNKLSAVTAAFDTAANSALGSLSEQARAAVRASLERKSEGRQRP